MCRTSRSQVSNLRLFLACVFAAGLVAQTTFPQAGGTVTNSVTGAPVPRARITLEVRNMTFMSIAGADGRFTLPGFQPGSYLVAAEKPGFVPANKAFDGKSEVEIKLIPTGAISGRVVDRDGEPMEGFSVNVEPARGRPVTTDEKGAFRIGGLAPGRYRVKASRHETLASRPEVRSDGTVEAHYAGTWYPGVLEEKASEWITVRPGVESIGADIRLVVVPFVRVSGKVVGIPDGVRGDFFVWQGGSSAGNSLKADGSFELWRLEPGKYVIHGQWTDPDGEPVRTAGAEIDVAGSNIDNVALRVVASSDIPGQLEFEDDQAKVMPNKESGPRRVRLSMVTEMGGSPPAPVDDDGTFRLERIAAGKYRVWLSWDGAYVKSMRLGSTIIDGSALDLSNGSGRGSVAAA